MSDSESPVNIDGRMIRTLCRLLLTVALALPAFAATKASSPDLLEQVTPTELKSGQQIAATPDFAILAARARDRISTLRALYGDGPLEIDFRAFGERARAVRMTRCEIRNLDIRRRSSRTGQVHPIGGFIGEAEYEGDLAEFVPYLKAAKWTGVGRQTVWGKGEIEIAIQASWSCAGRSSSSRKRWSLEQSMPTGSFMES